MSSTEYPQYRIRPATVEAVQFRLGTSTKAEMLAFCSEANIGVPWLDDKNDDATDIRWFIVPGRGDGEVRPDDWILRALNGTYTVLREDQFDRLYEPIVDLPGEYSQRGFYHWDFTETTYGQKVFVYESSAASAPHVWLRILDGDDIAAHLNVEQARTVRDQLDAWLTKAAA